MRSFGGGLYQYRRYFILKYKNGKGWWINSDSQYFCDLNVYATIEDCKQAINKREDGTHTREPIIIGRWEE